MQILVKKDVKFFGFFRIFISFLWKFTFYILKIANVQSRLTILSPTVFFSILIISRNFCAKNTIDLHFFHRHGQKVTLGK